VTAGLAAHVAGEYLFLDAQRDSRIPARSCGFARVASGVARWDVVQTHLIDGGIVGIAAGAFSRACRPCCSRGITRTKSN